MLQQWRHLDASELPCTELLRHVIEHALLAAHRHVFGVFFWFVLGSAMGLGPVGAVVYRMAEFCSRYWAFKTRAEVAAVNDGAVPAPRRLAFAVLDYVPARLTAAGFAVVGNFEEAVDAGASTPASGRTPTTASCCRPRPGPVASRWAAPTRR